MLDIQHLTKSFGQGKPAVAGLSLTVDSGDIYGFIGHNGAGKTTTLRCIAGILAFDSGDILIDGHSVKDEPLACKKITRYIPDNPDIYAHLTGVQYLNFLSDIYELPTDVRNARIRKYADAFEMTDRLGDLIGSCSHGMRQKIALIGALIDSPRLFLMDEPFVGLDPKAAFTLKEIMHELTQAGAAIFFSTHVLDVAEKLCNKVAVIKEGALVAQGDMETLRGDSSLEQVFLELTDQ